MRDASDFTFAFVGTFDPATLKPLVERYLGGLPATHLQEKWRDIGATPVTGVVKKRVEKGIEPRSDTVMVFTGPFQYNQMNRVLYYARSGTCCKTGCARACGRIWAGMVQRGGVGTQLHQTAA